MLNKTKVRQFVKSLAHNGVDLIFKVMQIVITFKKCHHIFCFLLLGPLVSVLFQGSQELMDLEIEYECKSGATAERQFTFEICIL